MDLSATKGMVVNVGPHPSEAAGGDWLGYVLSRNRYILGGALILALIVPEVLHPLLPWDGLWFATVSESWASPPLLAVLLAVLLGHLSLARMGILPLVAARSLVFPTFVATFGATSLTFLALGIPIGRYHLWTAFILTVGWYLLVAILRGRHLKASIATIGLNDEFGRNLPANVEWSVLLEPKLTGPVSAVVLDPDVCSDPVWSRFVTKLVLQGIPVYHRQHFEESLTGRVKFSDHSDNDFGSLLPSLLYLKVKRLLDIGGCILLLPIFGPIIILAAVLIQLESPGGAFFRQIRVGHRGRPFVCYKLRTMHIGIAGPKYTLAHDPRVTRLGRYFRKWRIDELPQIFNVLRGDMSWIGPRPEAASLARRYAANIPFYHYRHAVRPGISGWAAVHQGNVGDVDAAQVKLEYDFYYIRKFSPAMDFLILLRTFRTVFSGFGSR